MLFSRIRLKQLMHFWIVQFFAIRLKNVPESCPHYERYSTEFFVSLTKKRE
jgi:hypothetical protein